ncbi:NB-ARC domain-containing protein [Streptomyces sp. JH002]|uniref:AfsR/SARP family transcriptional regulator n=1 Tax=Streptomyces sp. JH002 TaxID=2763259 RepID=UPI003D80A12A
MTTGLRFSLLGPVRAWHDGAEIPLGSPQQRSTLSVLLLHAGGTVPAGQFASALWDGAPPRGARGTVRTYIHRLRRALEPQGAHIESGTHGYALMVEPTAIDAHRFRHLVGSARSAHGAGDHRGTARLSRQALDLWRGEPLVEIHGEAAERERVGLRQTRTSALDLYGSAALTLGRDDEVIQLMSVAVVEDPLHERFHELLMLALYRAGRQAEAISAYGRVRTVVRHELGVDPAASLTTLYERILRGDPALDPPHGGGDHALAGVRPGADSGTGGAAGGEPVPPQPCGPAQLPLPAPLFIGRGPDLAAALRDIGRGTRVIVVSGMAGVGKTEFATLLAHRLRREHHDGQLYLNLHGFDADRPMMPTAHAVDRLIEALDVPRQRIPRDAEARTAFLRRQLAGRRLLLFLDNARDAAHVLPLIPESAPGPLVLVTSRSPLAGLITARGARVSELRPFARQEALELMRGKLGPERMRGQERAAQDIVDCCGGLPLALAVVCAKAIANPSFSLAAIAGELRDARARISFLTGQDSSPGVRSVLSSSYRALSPAAAGLFRLLPLHPGRSAAAPFIADLLAQPLGRVQELLDELTAMRLLEERSPGRYGWHDLVRAYAVEVLADTTTPEERDAGLRRVLSHYLHTAHEAARILSRHHDMPPIRPLGRCSLSTYAEARSWFETEHGAILHLIDTAYRAGHDRTVWQLAWMVRHYLDVNGHWDELRTTSTLALRAAGREGSRLGMAMGHRGLSRAEYNAGQWGEAERHLHRALELIEGEGDRLVAAYTHRQLAGVHASAGAFEKMLAEARTSLKIFGELGWTVGEGAALSVIAKAQGRMRRYGEALVSAERALSMLEEAGELSDMARTMDLIGYAHHHLGRHREAIGYWRRAAELHASLGAVDKRNSHAMTALIHSLLYLAADEQRAGETGTARVTAVRAGQRLADYLELHRAGCPAADVPAGLGALIDELRGFVGELSEVPELTEALLRRLFALAARAQGLGGVIERLVDRETSAPHGLRAHPRVGD